MAVKYPIDALPKLQIKVDSCDLIVIDVHKSDMNGCKLQEMIAEAFEIPVLCELISSSFFPVFFLRKMVSILFIGR